MEAEVVSGLRVQEDDEWGYVLISAGRLRGWLSKRRKRRRADHDRRDHLEHRPSMFSIRTYRATAALSCPPWASVVHITFRTFRGISAASHTSASARHFGQGGHKSLARKALRGVEAPLRHLHHYSAPRARTVMLGSRGL